MADVKKARIGDAIYDVVSTTEYLRAPQVYRDQNTAIIGGDGYIYPVRPNMSDQRPGFFDCGPMYYFRPPLTKTDCAMYDSSNIIDFSQASSIKDVIRAQDKLASTEKAILSTIDNEFIPIVSEHDRPEMKLLKEAIASKHVDLDKYESRFGSNYNNDKRLLKKSSITFGKMVGMCNALDIKVTLVMEDRSSDVANPMGEKLSACITDVGDDGEETTDEST